MASNSNSPLPGPGIADGPLDRGGKDARAIAEEEAVVALGDHRIAAEDDHAAPLLEEGFERGNLGGGKLGDVAEDHGVEARQVAGAELRFADDLGPDRRQARAVGPPTGGGVGRLLGGAEGLDEVVGLALANASALGLPLTSRTSSGRRGPGRPGAGCCRPAGESSSIRTSRRWSPAVVNPGRKATVPSLPRRDLGDGLVRPDLPVDREPGLDVERGLRPEVVDRRQDPGGRTTHRHQRGIEPQANHRAVLAAVLAEVDHHRGHVAARELRHHGPLERVGAGDRCGTRRSPLVPLRRQLAAWRSVMKMTSLWLTGETFRTRSTASNVATRSVVPSGRRRVSISRMTSAPLADGAASPTTTRGGSAIRTTLKTSPGRASRTSCPARFRGLIEPGLIPRHERHAHRPVEDDHPVRPLPRQDHRPQAFQERLGHRSDDQQNHQRPDRQQQPLLDPDPALVLLERRDQEAHRRPAHLAVLPPVEQVDQDRQARRRDPELQTAPGWRTQKPRSLEQTRRLLSRRIAISQFRQQICSTR